MLFYDGLVCLEESGADPVITGLGFQIQIKK